MPALPPLLALPWLVPYLVLPMLSRRRPLLLAEAPAAGPLVSVIVPARNESGNINRLLTSLRATTYSPVEIVVVDDRSTDDTAARVEAHAKADPRVRLVRGEPLPPGWFGKPWACFQGAERAHGELLVFTDADTTHEPGFLAHAVGAFQRSGSDLLTVVTGQILKTFWERVVMPHFWLPLGLRYYPGRVNAATKPRDVLANGQFFMTSRTAYTRIGTHEAVRSEVAEDVVIGQRYLSAGLKIRMWWAEELIQTRMYTGFSHLVEGWSKNLYLGSRASFPGQPLLQASAPFVLLAGQAFWLAPLVALLVDGAGWAPWAIGLSAGFWAIISAGLKVPLWYGMTYPIGVLMLVYLVLRSGFRGRRKIEWRGRTYRGVEDGRSGSKAVEGGRE
ncbi:MAG TPA: glycosyltransferase family 2 protein [Gemmatimonadales bacterium]